MGRKGRGKGGGRGGSRGRSAGARRTGIEQYGQDAADEYLALDDDMDDGEASQDGEEEEDVMALKPYTEDDEETGKAKKGKSNKAKKKADVDEDEEDEEDLVPASKGWSRSDFYGGDDAGDDSDDEGDEDLTFKEARKLEELRAARLRGAADPLAALLGPGVEEKTDKAEKEETAGSTNSAVSALDADAQFESLFAAEAEKSSMQRDLTQLPSSKRRSLLKKESPELLPLLEDFKAKLERLRPLLPLLKSGALARLPASGASYVEAKVSLLLSHLANLSFYLLTKAEGGDVRAHPVISQLVWLKELDEQMASVDKRLGAKLKRATKAAEKLAEAPVDPSPVLPTVTEGTKAAAESAAAKPAGQRPLPTLAERLGRLRGKPSNGTAKPATGGEAKRPVSGAASAASTASLLKLPGRRRRNVGGSGEAPADLDELDPTLGAWLPSSSLNQQLTEVQQHLKERKAKAAPEGADVNPEPRARVHRERAREEIDPRMAADAARGLDAASDDEAEEGEEAGGDLIRQAKAKAKARKEQKVAALSAKEKAKLARQYKPEQVLEGRRETSRKILENRGLARQRKKKAGNARVANREKYDKMVKRRKGAVQEMREAAADGATYEGEATGVRTHVRKSQKLG